MAEGTVKWFNESKGFGFINMDNGEEVYVDHAAIQADGRKTLKEGQRVQFELQASPKGAKALRVRPIR